MEVAEPGPGAPAARALPRLSTGLSAQRRWSGLGVALVGLPLLTVVLGGDRTILSLGSVLLLYLLAVVVVAVVGGVWPGVLASVASALAANWFFVPPYHTFAVESRDTVVELVVFVLVSVVVAGAVELAARDRTRAARSRAEVDLLAGVVARPAASLDVREVLEQVRTTFGMTSAELVRTSSKPGSAAPPRVSVVASVGAARDDDAVIRAPAGGDLELVLHGPQLFAEDRGALRRLALAAARAWETQRLTRLADRLTEADQERSALLAAVGHDLRTPLAGLKAAVSTLRQDDVEWEPEVIAELLATIEESADRLDGLIANILDMTRIQVGAVVAHPADVSVDEVVARARIDVPSGAVRLAVPDDLPDVRTDPVLMERVLANLLDNAVRHSPPDRPVEVVARAVAGGLDVAVVDHGPGVPDELWDAMFTPFQRLDDHAAGPGTGLGLAIVRGFAAACGVPVTPSATPGGGLTMTVRLPWAAQP